MKRSGIYLVEYGMDGSRWIIDVPAASPEDAKRRLATAASFGEILNPLGESYRVPAAVGFWVPTWVWLRNALKI